MDNENFPSVIVPVLDNQLSVLTIVVPTDFSTRFQMRAAQIIEAFERHPSERQMDDNNKLMQAMSFLLQTSFDFYQEHVEEPDFEIPPEISDP
jgi:hypothetical protein|tara:strand:+ start:299 stop:577 length:279 start_codon:yes stop_codon:yes gene_type:complete